MANHYHSLEDAAQIRTHRSRIETANARTHPGCSLKVLASLLALTFTSIRIHPSPDYPP